MLITLVHSGASIYVVICSLFYMLLSLLVILNSSKLKNRSENKHVNKLYNNKFELSGRNES